MAGKYKPINKNKLSSRARTAEQCWLVANTNQILEWYNKSESKDENWKNATLCAFNKHYVSFDKDIDFQTIVGRYFIDPDTYEMWNIETHELSALIPKIRLFRIEIDENGKVKDGYQQEFFFSTHSNPESIKQLLSGERTRIGDAGIVSANWKILGGHPGEVKRKVQVDLEFFFSSLQTMVEPLINETYDYAGKNTVPPTYLDLFRRGYGPADKLSQFRLRMDVGWSIPEKDSHIFKNKPRLRNAIRKLTKTLWLQLTTHDIQFEQDGTIKLNISYMSSLEYDFQTIKVISDKNADGGKEALKKFNKELTEAKKIEKEYKDCATKKPPFRFGWFGLRGQTKETMIKQRQYEYDQENLKVMGKNLKTASSFKPVDGMLALQRINNILYSPILTPQINTGGPTELRTRVFQVNIFPEEFGFAAEWTGLFSSKSTTYDPTMSYPDYKCKKLRFNKRKVEKSDGTVQGLKRYSKSLATSKSDRDKIVPVPVGSMTYDNKKVTKLIKGYNRLNKKQKQKNIQMLYRQFAPQFEIKSDFTDSRGQNLHQKVPIRFCFLGDLFDTIIDTCIVNNNNKEIRSLIRNTKFVLGHTKIPYSSCGDGDPVVDWRTISLNDLPVSLNRFNAWFIKNVIDSGKQIISLDTFMRSLITELIGTSFSTDCFVKRSAGYKQLIRNEINTAIYTVRVPKGSGEIFTKIKGPLGEATSFGERNQKQRSKIIEAVKRKRISVDEFKKLKKENWSEAPPDSEFDLLNYFVIDVRNPSWAPRLRDRVKDIEDGIFWFGIGQDSGFIKSISFNRSPSKFFEESMIVHDYKKNELNMFRRIYNVEIKIYGNSTFMPGQTIYVDPSTVGQGEGFVGEAVARELGFGGYYLIIGVENTISSGVFETTLTARFTGTGLVAKKLQDYKKQKKAAAKKKKTGQKIQQASAGCDKKKAALVESWNKLNPPFDDLVKIDNFKDHSQRKAMNDKRDRKNQDRDYTPD